MVCADYNHFNVWHNGQHIAIQIDRDAAWSHEKLCDILSVSSRQSVRFILIDKRNHITKCRNEKFGVNIGEKLGKYLVEKNARLAVVLHKDDHMEKIAFYGASKNGGRVLSTDNYDEAVFWLRGEFV